MNPTASSNMPQGNAAILTDRAKQDLANRVKVDVGAIRVISAQEMEWSDSSLGCPKPDTAYMQVITPGYLITLEVNGSTYQYHTDTNRAIVFCEQPKLSR